MNGNMTLDALLLHFVQVMREGIIKHIETTHSGLRIKAYIMTPRKYRIDIIEEEKEDDSERTG